MARPPTNTGLRLPPSTKAEMRAVLEALEAEGETVGQDHLVGALIRRAASVVDDQKKLAALGKEMRQHRVRARSEGY